MSFEKLDSLCRSLDALDHAQAILGADEATHMAVGGGDSRAEAMAVLAGMHHRQATAPEIAEGDDPRQALAAWITSDQNDYFVQTIANRV